MNAPKTANLDTLIRELAEHACELSNALHAYEMLYPDPTVKSTLEKFYKFQSDNDLTGA
jgi:hypothetical protein